MLQLMLAVIVVGIVYRSKYKAKLSFFYFLLEISRIYGGHWWFIGRFKRLWMSRNTVYRVSFYSLKAVTGVLVNSHTCMMNGGGSCSRSRNLHLLMWNWVWDVLSLFHGPTIDFLKCGSHWIEVLSYYSKRLFPKVYWWSQQTLLIDITMLLQI